jgi:D-methionine transport system ATP-binding protein
MAHITLTDVSKSYPPQKRRGERIAAVDAVSLEVERGEIFGVIGHSGAGKSTLVRLVNGLEPVTDGSIEIDGIDITRLPQAKLREVRQKIGMIFQRFNLLRSRTISRNVAYPLEVAGMPRGERKARVAELLDFVGLGDKADAYPEQLSGGQQQRVGIARALAAHPEILLADEATSALDPETTDEVLDLLARVNRELTDPQTPTARRFVRTVVRALPEGEALAALRAQHPGRFFTISFRDDGVNEARVFGALARAGIDFNMVHGGIDDIQGRVYGLLTIAVRGQESAVREALAGIGPHVTVTEVTE